MMQGVDAIQHRIGSLLLVTMHEQGVYYCNALYCEPASRLKTIRTCKSLNRIKPEVTGHHTQSNVAAYCHCLLLHCTPDYCSLLCDASTGSVCSVPILYNIYCYLAREPFGLHTPRVTISYSGRFSTPHYLLYSELGQWTPSYQQAMGHRTC